MFDHMLHFFGRNALENLKGFDIIFRSPSCMPTIREIVEEEKRGAIVTSEIEMLMKLCPGTVIGVTGSDGKTTTTSLIYEIAALKEIALPLLEKITPDKKEHAEAVRLINILKYFEPISSEFIPANSLLKEFLGGGYFEY